MTTSERLRKFSVEQPTFSVLTTAADELDALRAMLRQVEWDTSGCCAVCESHHENGHTPDCRLAKLLKEGE